MKRLNLNEFRKTQQYKELISYDIINETDDVIRDNEEQLMFYCRTYELEQFRNYENVLIYVESDNAVFHSIVVIFDRHLKIQS